MHKRGPLFEENSIYRYVQDHEFLIPPISGALIGIMTGSKTGGIYGAMMGGTIGAVFGFTDHILIQYDITSKHYFTYAMLGIGIGNSFQLPYYIGETIGFTAGFAAPTGYLSSLSWIVPIATTMAVTTHYAKVKQYSKLYGAAAGAVISFTDESLIHYNITEKRYLSTATIIATNFDFMLPQFNKMLGYVAGCNQYTNALYGLLSDFFSKIPYISLGSGTIVGAYVANQTEVNLLSWKPIPLSNELLATYGRIIDRDILEERMELFAIASIATRVFWNAMILRESISFQMIGPLYEKLGETNTASVWNPLRSELIRYMISIVPPLTISEMFNSVLNNYFSRQINYLAENSINKEWLANNTAIKLSNSEDAITIIHYKTTDVFLISKIGSLLLLDAFSKAIATIMSMGLILNNKAVDILIYSFIYNQFTSAVSELISEKINEHTDQIRDLKALKDNIEKDITNKAETITERGGIEYHLNKLTDIDARLRVLLEQQELWEQLHPIWIRAKEFFNVILNYFTTGYKVHNNELDFDARYKVLDSISKNFFALMSFEMDNIAAILQVEKANDSVNTLLDIMRNSSSAVQEQYNREYRPGELAITFENFTISIKDGKQLVHLDSLKLTKGIYAITGPKGSGKSSFLSKIIGLDYNNIVADGTIIFYTKDGQKPLLVSIPQIDHIPFNCSLIELIKYPNPLPTDSDQLASLHTTIVALWDRIGSTNISSTGTESLMARLNSTENWESILSGGQKKVIHLMSAILQSRDILFLDETFNGLDLKSKKAVQDLLKEFVAPTSIILSIDHHAEGNVNNFYDACLNLENGTLKVYEKCIFDSDISQNGTGLV